jgi:hypothetical protein
LSDLGHPIRIPDKPSNASQSETPRSLAHALPIATLLLAWALFVMAVYCPDVGRGFVKDDFTWIRSAKAVIAQPARLIRPLDAGFYRPVVTATFVWDYGGHDPRGRGRLRVSRGSVCVFFRR